LVATNQVITNHRQTYVLPNRFGYLLLLITLLMMIAATNYQNSMAFLLTFFLVALGFNNLLINYRNLVDLEIRIFPCTAVHVGQTLKIPVSVKRLSDREHYSVGLGTKDSVQKIFDITSTSETNTSVDFFPTQRGWYQPERFYLVTSYPFGLLRVWSWFRCKQQYLIYPKPEVPPAIDNQLGHRSEANSHEQMAGNEDFFSIRDYQQGDSKRAIHWRAYAREQGLVTKEFSEPKGDNEYFDYQMFNTIDPYNRIELRLSWLCYLIVEAHRKQRPFGLILPSINIAPDMSTQHLNSCLTALALFGKES